MEIANSYTALQMIDELAKIKTAIKKLDKEQSVIAKKTNSKKMRFLYYFPAAIIIILTIFIISYMVHNAPDQDLL